jgi:thiol-disulfide isomerase/thioredoxin
MRQSLAALFVLAPLATLLTLPGCKTQADAAPEPVTTTATSATAKPPARKLLLTEAPAEGDVEDIVRGTLSQAAADGRRLVVYVGAKWCEPCQRFHHAAERGELDGVFGDLQILVFDLDRDNERLASAGYVSKLIPLFALPGPDGRASGKQVEGGIKGEGAVGNIAPRLKQMLLD